MAGDPFPQSIDINIILAEGLRLRDRHRQDQQERYQNAKAVKWFGVGAFALGMIGAIWSVLPAHADDKPMPAFTQDCKPALEVLGKLMLEKKEMPWKAGKVGETEFVITRNDKTRAATFLVVCEQDALLGGDMHRPMSSRVVPQLRVMFTFEIDDVNREALPWVKA